MIPVVGKNYYTLYCFFDTDFKNSCLYEILSMSNLEQVKAQIRFGLSQLAETNSHHEFEHLCRHLTRARICSNIIPATGPVSNGGDQGRDFETFNTYINKDPSEGTSFTGLISGKQIVFACSMQKENILNKINQTSKKLWVLDPK